MTSVDAYSILSATGLLAVIAVAEEFLFRGFVFQPLPVSIGQWGAQLIITDAFS
jgi:membrane protease YdiL (CAAX protease family)